MPLNTLSQIFNTTAIKAVPNQNNNLLDFVGTSGTTVASVTFGGLIDLRAANGTPLTLNPNDASVIGDKIRLWGSQFGLGIQDSRLVSYLPTTGAFAIRNTLAGSDLIRLNGDGSVFASSAIFTNTSAATIALRVISATSQSADLQRWDDSSGFPLAKITSGGKAAFGNTFFTNGIVSITAFNPTDIPLHIRAAEIGQSANLTEWIGFTGSTVASVNSSGQFVGDGSQLTGISAGANEIMVIMGAY